jgi:hypothetical protein
MPGTFFYQWQNPILLKTIYPMRELKLRDFLIFDFEVELWEKYFPIWQTSKDHIPEELKEEERQVLTREKGKLQQALNAYADDLKALSGEVVLDPKHDYLGRIIPAIRVMHRMFRDRFETFSKNKQSNYLRDRVAEFNELLKEVDRQIANKQRAIRNNGQEWAQRSGYPAVIELLNDRTRPMVERELHLITRFQAAFERMVEYEQKRKAREAIWQAKRRKAEQELAKLEKDAKLEETKLNNLREEVNRYRRVQQVEEHQPHFLTSNIKAVYRSEFNRVDLDILDQIQRIHVQIRNHFKQPGSRADFLQNRVLFLESVLRLAPPNKATAEARRMIGLKELNRLEEFQLAHARVEKPQAVQARLKELETELAGLETKLKGIQEKRRGPKTVLDDVIRGLSVPKEQQVIAMVDLKKIGIVDIVHDQIEHYRAELEKKDAQQLLEEVVRMFMKDPKKYPLWLQYMVVHFSGMRYKSAHGCWQHPRQLLNELRKQKFLQGADSVGLEQLDDTQALQRLAALEGRVPGWMWREIVRLTELKLNRVSNEQWEPFTPGEIEEMYKPGSGKLRQALFDWKKVITVWREEHQRTKRLIVTSAVCNEVAEHIQHLRGIKPPGGLTDKPAWYISQEKLSVQEPENKRAYFVKAKNAVAFKEGASIFWLRWVRKYPNLAQVTRPLVLHTGDPLVPLENTHPKIMIDNNDYKRIAKIPDPTSTDRFRSTQDQEQWLRWMHESTVVKVVDTAEGKVVYTFETSLPDEPRSQATMGVSKRYLAHLIHNFPTEDGRGIFVGYVPEGNIPFEPLKEMLDWNKILLREAYTPVELEAFWKQVMEPAAV